MEKEKDASAEKEEGKTEGEIQVESLKRLFLQPFFVFNVLLVVVEFLGFVSIRPSYSLLRLAILYLLRK